MAKPNQKSLPMGANAQAPPPSEDTTQTLQNGQPQRTAPLEATQQEKPVGKRRGGRRKIPMLRINDDKNRLITFSKRRVGIYKKATEIGTLCGIDVGISIFSPAGKAYAYGVPNIDSITNRLLRGMNPDAQNGTRIVNETQRRENMGKLNNMYDELSVYLQSLKEEENKLMEMKKQTLDDDCWWDIPVEDLTAVKMQKMTTAMEELKKSSSMRFSDLRAGASSSRAVVQPEDIQMGINEGFRYVGDGGFGDLREGGSSSSAVAGVQGGTMQMGGNIGQRFGGGAGDNGRFGDRGAGSSTAAGIQGSGFQQDGNGGLGALGDWGASSSVQAGGMQMRGNGVNGYGGAVGGNFGALMAGGSSSASVQQGGMRVGGHGRGGSGGGDDAGGGIGGGVGGRGFGALPVGGSSAASIQQGVGKWRPVGLAVATSAVQPAVGGNLGTGYAGSAGGSGGFGDWGAGGPMAAGIQGGGFQLDGNGGLGGSVGGPGDWGTSSSVQAGGMQMGGNGGSGYSGGVGAYFTAGGSSAASVKQGGMQMREFGGGGFGGGGGAGCEFGGGGGGFSDFAAGSSAAVALHPDQDQMGGAGNGGSFYDGGGGVDTNNRFGGFLYDEGSKFI